VACTPSEDSLIPVVTSHTLATLDPPVYQESKPDWRIRDQFDGQYLHFKGSPRRNHWYHFILTQLKKRADTISMARIQACPMSNAYTPLYFHTYWACKPRPWLNRCHQMEGAEPKQNLKSSHRCCVHRFSDTYTCQPLQATKVSPDCGEENSQPANNSHIQRPYVKPLHSFGLRPKVLPKVIWHKQKTLLISFKFAPTKSA
jgi:hypothetical protein